VVAAVGITSVLLFGAVVALILVWYADVRPLHRVIGLGLGLAG
jgi:hypothetical protein